MREGGHWAASPSPNPSRALGRTSLLDHRVAAGLAAELARLADREWLHRKSAEPVRFAVSTLERWYYTARNAPDPVAALARSPRKDRGRVRAVTSALGAVVRKQWSEHPSWSYQLHRDNLAVEVAERPAGRRGEAERRAGQARDAPARPAQNGKQEVLWAQVQGRLMAMLEGEPSLRPSC